MVPRLLSSAVPESQLQELAAQPGASRLGLYAAAVGAQVWGSTVVKLKPPLYALAPQLLEARALHQYWVLLFSAGVTVQVLAVRAVAERAMLANAESVDT